MDSLTQRDYDALAASWITQDLTQAAGIRRVDSSEGAALVGRNGSGDYAGLCFPYRLPGETRVREHRLRLDHPPVERRADGSPKERFRYLSPPGRGNLAYFPPDATPEQVANVSLPVVITEGEKKTLALHRLATHQTNTPLWLAVGLGGVWSWRGTIGKAQGPNGERLDEKGVISDLERIAWKGRTVFIVFDNDSARNPSVAVARRELAKALTQRGAGVRIVELPDGPCKGVDDLLSASGPDAVLPLFEAATDAEPEFRLTDLGNAERFANDHSDRLRYCHPWGSWLAWDGRRWKRDDSGAVYRLAADTVRGMYAAASRLDDADRRSKLAKHAGNSEKRERLTAMVDLARNLEPFIVRVEELNSDSMILNCEDGMLDLRTGELRPHDPAELLTRLAPVHYDPEATAPTFEAFLRRIFNGDVDLMHFVRRAAGYSLTGNVGEQCLFLCHGTGANGKSTLLAVLQDLLGDYAATTPAETLLAKRYGDSIPNDLARLAGLRLVASSETEDGRALAESRIKAMTGGDRITARFMRSEWFEFEPAFKLWLATNHRPEIKGAEGAIWRRIRLVPFLVTIPEDERDPDLLDKLRGELPGILAWAVRGCLEWQAERLCAPAAVTTATDDYRAESDQLGRFFEERCVLGGGFEAGAGMLYRAYKAWCGECSEDPVTSTMFGRRLTERGFSKRHTERGNVYESIGLQHDG